MAPRKTRAIGIFANSACVESLTSRKSDRPLFSNADVQTNENGMKLGSAFGQEQTDSTKLRLIMVNNSLNAVTRAVEEMVAQMNERHLTRATKTSRVDITLTKRTHK